MPKRILIWIDISSSYGRSVVAGIGKFRPPGGDWRLVLEQRTDIAPAMVQEQEADGIIAQFPFTRVPEGAAARLVNVSDEGSPGNMPTVMSDNRQIGAMAADHLLERGFRNFACCAFQPAYYARGRMDGFAQAVKKAGCKCHRIGAQGMRRRHLPAWRQYVRNWLENLPKPVGLLAANDVFGRLVIMECIACGISVPRDVAVMGVDNDQMICELSDVPLTSIQPDAERIGYLAAKLLAGLLAGTAPPQAATIVPPVGVVSRASTSAAVADDPQMAKVLRFIMDSAGKPINVSDVLKQVSMSRRSLEYRCRELFGRSPAAEIIRAHISRAKELLRATDLQMPKVAQGSGFRDAMHLAKAFRRETGLTPTQYRSQHRLR